MAYESNTVDTEEFLEEQRLDEENEELRQLIYSRLEIFGQTLQEEHDKAKECRQVLHMDDPKQDTAQTLEQNGKKTLQLQTLKSTINNVVADQMLSMPEAKLLPETPDMQDAADELQDLVHHVVYVVNKFAKTQYRRCEDFYATGTAVTQIAWDPDMAYGKGDIAIIRWPVEAFLWDPYVEDLQESRAVMKLSFHPLSYFEEHWPDAGRYASSDADEYGGYGMTTGQEDTEHNDDEKRALLIEYWWRTYDASTRRYTVNVAYAGGGALLEVHKDVYAHGMYPFVIDNHDSIEGQLNGAGLIEELVNMMRYINRYASYADMNARRASKGRILTRKGSGIDLDALTDWEQDVIEGDNISADSVIWLQTQPFPASIMQLMTMFQSDLKADSGANQFTRGETTGGIVSGKAINSLIQAGGKIASMRTEQLKYGFQEIVEQVIWLMAQFYDKKRTVMITGKDGNRKALEIDPGKLFGKKLKGAVAPPPYVVEIEVSSRDPQRVANQNQMFMEAFTMAAQTEHPMKLSDLFKILNLDGKDKILPVIEANEHYQEMMQQLQQQVAQLQGQIEQMQAENQSLRKEAIDSTNALTKVAAKRGGNIVPQAGGGPTKVAEAGGGQNTAGAIVAASRNTLGMPLGGAELQG